MLTHDVLTLGEKIVMAARLAAIEHVRQEVDVQAVAAALAASKNGESAIGRGLGGSTAPGFASGFTDGSDDAVLTRPVAAILKDVFGRIEAQHRRRAGAA